MRTSSDALIVVSAPSKINLYLGIHTEKDERGYHRVDSVMAALDLADTLRIEPANELVVLTEPAVDVPMERNTAYRAAVELACAFGLEPRVRIAIEKRIPLQAGLGGPSADAAATLVGLCKLWGIDVQDERGIESRAASAPTSPSSCTARSHISMVQATACGSASNRSQACPSCS